MVKYEGECKNTIKKDAGSQRPLSFPVTRVYGNNRVGNSCVYLKVRSTGQYHREYFYEPRRLEKKCTYDNTH